MNNYEWQDTAPDTEGFYWLYGDPEFGTMGGNYTGAYPMEYEFHVVHISKLGDSLTGVSQGRLIFLNPFNEMERKPGWVGQWMKIDVPLRPGPPVPTLLSEAIDMAVNDLEAVEKDAANRVDMATWHSSINPADEQVCAVCFAGSIMAKSLHLPSDVHVDTEDMIEKFGERWDAVFQTLDFLRKDSLQDALWSWDEVFPSGDPPHDYSKLNKYDHNLPEYAKDPEGFKKAMRALAEQCRTIEKS